MSKKYGKRLATGIMFAVAGSVCLVWFVFLLQSAIMYAQLGTLGGGIIETFLGTIFGATAIAIWIEVVVFAIAAALLLYATYKTWKSKWGKTQKALTLAIVAVVIVGILSVLAYVI